MSQRSAGSLATVDLTVRFAGARKDAVQRANLTVAAGEIWAILGPSGSGKSTLLRAIAGVQTPTSGQVLCAGKDVTQVPTHRRGMSLMFQEGQLFDHLDVAGNVGYPLRVAPRASRTRKQQRAGLVAAALEMVGLAGFEGRAVAGLSGGEQQRVALARALVARPAVVLLDEPFSSLDSALRQQLAQATWGLLKASATTALLVTHDHAEAFAVADHVAVMRQGEVLRAGVLKDVWEDPQTSLVAEILGYHVLTAQHSDYLSAWALGRPSLTASGQRLAVRTAGLAMCLSTDPGARPARVGPGRPDLLKGTVTVELDDEAGFWTATTTRLLGRSDDSGVWGEPEPGSEGSRVWVAPRATHVVSVQG